MCNLVNKTKQNKTQNNNLVNKNKKQKRSRLTYIKKKTSGYQWGEGKGEGQYRGRGRKGLLWDYMKSCV